MENGIDIKKLKSGTKITIRTLNSTYEMEVGEQENEVLIQGGEYFSQPQIVHFCGSTWGGSAICLGWIGYGMHMELYWDDKKLTTSAVQEAVITGDNWEYKIDWSNKEIRKSPF
jgi:hypothetical protein